MTKSIILTLSLLILTGHLSGCANSQPPDVLATWQRDGTIQPKMVPVSKDGSYGLYPSTGNDPIKKVTLHAGDQLGFQNQDGKIVAAYSPRGDMKTESLDAVLDGGYLWKFLGDK